MIRFDSQNARKACLGVAAVATVGLAGLWGATTGATPVAEEQKGPVAERQFIMQQLDEESELLGNISAGIEPADKLAETTRAIANGAKASVESFQAIAPGGRSKDEVWSKHDDFMQRMQTFAKNAEIMAKVGETGSLADVNNVMVAAMPCKECHDIYRAPKKPT